MGQAGLHPAQLSSLLAQGGLFSPSLWGYPRLLWGCQPISFPWGYPAYPAHIFVGVGCPAHILSLGLSSPYSFGVGCPAHFFGAIQPIFFWVYPAHILLGLSSPYPFLEAIQPIFFWCGLSSPYPFFGAIQPIFFWCGFSPFLWSYPAHILLGLSSPYSFGAVQPISFPWGCPAHILSLELSSPFPFLGAVQPTSFLWSYPAHIFVGVGCPAHILSLGLSSPYPFFGAIQPIFLLVWAVHPISFLWGYPAHILLVWVVKPISLELSSPYSFGSIQPIFFWCCPAHILP